MERARGYTELMYYQRKVMVVLIEIKVVEYFSEVLGKGGIRVSFEILGL